LFVVGTVTHFTAQFRCVKMAIWFRVEGDV